MFFSKYTEISFLCHFDSASMEIIAALLHLLFFFKSTRLSFCYSSCQTRLLKRWNLGFWDCKILVQKTLLTLQMKSSNKLTELGSDVRSFFQISFKLLESLTISSPWICLNICSNTSLSLSDSLAPLPPGSPPSQLGSPSPSSPLPNPRNLPKPSVNSSRLKCIFIHKLRNFLLNVLFDVCCFYIEGWV